MRRRLADAAEARHVLHSEIGGPWLVAIVGAMAAFMEILDTSIANVARRISPGNLGVSNDEKHLGADLVPRPSQCDCAAHDRLAGRCMSGQRAFPVMHSMFTLSSLLCGLGGGSLVLLLAACSRGRRRGSAACAGDPRRCVSTCSGAGWHSRCSGSDDHCAHASGPRLAGGLPMLFVALDLYHQPARLALTFILIRRLIADPHQSRRVPHGGVRVGYIGLALLVVGVGALQIALDKGQEEDWLASPFIATLAAIAVICLVSLAVWEWRAPNPLINVRLFRSRNFLSAAVMLFLLGVLLFSSLVMMPQFLQTELGYTSQSAGLVLSAGAMIMFITMPIVGRLTTRMQARYMVAFGWACLAFAMFYTTTRLDLQVSFTSMAWLGAAQRAGLHSSSFHIVGGLRWAAAGGQQRCCRLMNFMRNIGASVGTSLVTTLIARRAAFHQATLVDTRRRRVGRFTKRWRRSPLGWCS